MARSSHSDTRFDRTRHIKVPSPTSPTFFLVAVAFFFGAMSVMEGKGIAGATDRIQTVSVHGITEHGITPPFQAYEPTLIRNWQAHSVQK